MSTYRVYRIDHYDPELIGKRKRRTNFLFAASSVLFIGVFFLLQSALKFEFSTYFSIAAPTMMVIAVYLQYQLSSYNRKLKTIGEIEFTKSAVKKKIGDSLFEFSYRSIKSIELVKHIPAVRISESKTGYFTYLLYISFWDAPREALVVSDLPAGRWRDLSIKETLRTLQKITSIEIKID